MRVRLGFAAYVAAFLLLAAILTYPIYGVPFFWVSILVAVAAGVLVAFLRTRFRWSLLTTALFTAGVYLLVALPATNPQAMTSLPAALRGWLESLGGVIFAWKQLVTIDPPVGTYHALLVPAFLVFYLATLISASLLVRSISRFGVAIVPLILPSIFGLAFGQVTLASDVSLFGLRLPIAGSVLAGILLLALSIAYLAWGSRAVRRAATTGSSGALGRRARRSAIAIGVVAVATIIGVVIVGSVGVPATRSVVRSGIDPMKDIARAVSPLSSYRAAFADTTALTAPRVTFSTDDPQLSRIRLAVMPYFDGQVYRITPASGNYDSSALYKRMPADLPSHTGSDQVHTTAVTVGDDSTMWLPVVDDLKQVQFTGASAEKLTDAFFINPSTNSGVIVPGMVSGATYTLTNYARTQASDPASLESSGASTVDDALVPTSLRDWLELQRQSNIDASTGTGLAQLMSALRARTYLSHSLDAPVAESGQAVWTGALGGYSFESSLSGHSTGRLDKLFSALVERQNARPTASDSELVAATADDEQIAAAGALIAAVSGYQSRVVLGYRTSASADTAYVIPPCAAGVCTGANLTAWVEVAAPDGNWVSFDTTPQFQNRITPQSNERQDPKNPTQVTTDTAAVLPPAPANPAAGASTTPDPGFVFDLGWLFDILGRVFKVLLIIAVILSPFVVVIGTKVRRRRERRRESDPSLAVMGAWDEYFDTALDHGWSAPRRLTRRELAEVYATVVEQPDATVLAQLADEAAFAPYDPSPSEVIAAWEFADAQRQRYAREDSLFRRALAWMSLRSFVRQVDPAAQLQRVQGMFAFEHRDESERATGFVAFLRYVSARAARAGRTWWHALRSRRGGQRRASRDIRGAGGQSEPVNSSSQSEFSGGGDVRE